METVDILVPPTFKKSGKTKSLKQAWKDQDWIGTFNLWVVQSKPVLSVIYQVRDRNMNWAPGKLDVTAGGHYQAGETIKQGLREVEEELGKKYNFKSLAGLGRKIHVSPDTEGNVRYNIVDIFMVEDNSPLNSYVLEKAEVYAICACPVADLLKVHSVKDYTFEADTLSNKGEKDKMLIGKNSFPYNWDDYHYKIATLAKKFLRGEKNLIY